MFFSQKESMFTQFTHVNCGILVNVVECRKVKDTDLALVTDRHLKSRQYQSTFDLSLNISNIEVIKALSQRALQVIQFTFDRHILYGQVYCVLHYIFLVGRFLMLCSYLILFSLCSMSCSATVAIDDSQFISDPLYSFHAVCGVLHKEVGAHVPTSNQCLQLICKDHIFLYYLFIYLFRICSILILYLFVSDITRSITQLFICSSRLCPNWFNCCCVLL